MWLLSVRGGVLLGASNEDSYSESSISSSLVAKRKSRFEGDESISYVALDDAIVDILSSIQIRFGLVPKRWILQHVQCFRVGYRIRHKNCTLALTFEGCHWGRRWKNLDRILCIFYFKFFHM